MRIACIVACSILLHGCGSGPISEPSMSSGVATISTSEFRSRIQGFEEGYLTATAFPEVISSPTSGSATFAGQLAFDYGGDNRGTAHANLSMNVEFGSGEVRGRADQFALAASEGTTTTLSGGLDVMGRTRLGQVDADLEGSLAGPASGPYRVLSGTVNLDGSFRGLNNSAEMVVGTIAGSLDGSSSLSITSGAFFATRERR
jgi:hypothetical protein